MLSVVPVSGPDDCGNPLPEWPDNGPPPSQVSNNTTVNIGGGVAIAVPIAIVPVKLDATLNIPTSIQVDVGPFNVNFDMGGVNIKPNFQIGPDVQIPPPAYLPPGTSLPKPVDRDNAPPAKVIPPCDLTPVVSRLNALKTVTDDIKDCSCPGKVAEQLTALGNGNSGAAALPPNTRYVRFNVGTLEANVSGQYGGGVAPNVRYVGWASFSDGPQAGGDRIQLQYQLNTLECPPNATAVNWTIKGDMVASVAAVHVVPEDSTFEPAIKQFKKKPK